MQNQPLVAIAIPVYNTEPYFRECLDHIIGQTYQNWICCITDNASTDKTYEIALEYAAKDSRFKVFRNAKTTTPWENFNIAYSHLVDIDAKYAKAEPADDWMYPECIEKMVEVLERDDEIGVCFAYSLKDKEVYSDGLDINQGDVFDGRKLLYNYLKNGDYIVGQLGTPIYRMSSLRQLNPNLAIYNEQNIHCDVELANDIMKNWKVGFVYQVLTYYRLHGEQGLAMALRLNTDLYGHEVEFSKYLSEFEDLENVYRQHRLDYALFYLQTRKKNDIEALEWHEKYLVKHLSRPVTREEETAAVSRQVKFFAKESYTNLKRMFKSILLLRYRQK